jgi:hypothetical protein
MWNVFGCRGVGVSRLAMVMLVSFLLPKKLPVLALLLSSASDLSSEGM